MEEKIAEPKIPCNSPYHEPATMIVRSPGTYRHTCSQCGKVVIFEVPLVTF